MPEDQIALVGLLLDFVKAKDEKRRITIGGFERILTAQVKNFRLDSTRDSHYVELVVKTKIPRVRE